MIREGFLRQVRLARDQVDDLAAFPYCLPALRGFEKLELHPAVTFFVGENGSGKSTLLEAIAIKAGLNPEGGTKSFRFAARPSESNLHAHLRLMRSSRREKRAFFLRAESMFNVATEAEKLGLATWETLHAMSHGEAFLWVLAEKFAAEGLYLLDEPEAALSPLRQLAALRRMHDLTRQGCQFVIATHSPILMAFPDAWIYAFGEEGIKRGAYRETEHYAVSRRFLNDPEASLRALFGDGDE